MPSRSAEVDASIAAAPEVRRPAHAYRAELEHLDLGRGCIRYRKPEDVDLDLVRSLLRSTANAGP